MNFRKLPLTILLCALFPFGPSLADAQIDIKYDNQTDFLELKVKNAYLEDVLNRLSERIAFTLVNDGNFNRIVNLSVEGRTKSVILKLVKSSSIIMSQSDTPPHKVTRLILLPTGTEQSVHVKQRSLSPPVPTGDPGWDEKKMAHYLRKLKQLSDGPIGDRGRVATPVKLAPRD